METGQAKTQFIRLIALIIISIVIVYGCGEQEPANPKATGIYSGWKIYQLENFTILYDSGHPNEDKFPATARNYLNVLEQVTTKLEMGKYTDTLLLVYYTGYGQGKSMTGHEFPYATDTAIHFWIPSFPGPTLMQHLLPRWVPGTPRHQFLYHGLQALFDFSGQPYHLLTAKIVNRGRFIKLSDLVVDTVIDANFERYQTAEAASFCAFILGEGGPSALKKMYGSRKDFSSTVQAIFGVSVDSLETYWMQFIRMNVSADSLVDSLWDKYEIK